MIDTRIATAGMWGLSADGLQWILLRGRDRDGGWRPMSFVRSTRDILARCMREKGVPTQDAARLLAGLPAIFPNGREPRIPGVSQQPQQQHQQQQRAKPED